MTLSQEIIALERSALDRWIAFDPQGYLDLSAPEVTYFDPFREYRVDGLETLKARLEPIKQFKGSITEPRYEMIDPKVQQYGDVALLTSISRTTGKYPADQRLCLPGGIRASYTHGLGKSGSLSIATGRTQNRILNRGRRSSRQLVSAGALQ